jgi:oligopeptidase B
LATGKDLTESFDIAGSFYWANDSKTLLYDTKDKVTLRNDKIWRHTLGTPHDRDVLMYHETDETQYAYLDKSKSEQYFFINSAYTQTVEVRYLNADNPAGTFTVVRPREAGFYLTIWSTGMINLSYAPTGMHRTSGSWRHLLPIPASKTGKMCSRTGKTH